MRLGEYKRIVNINGVIPDNTATIGMTIARTAVVESFVLLVLKIKENHGVKREKKTMRGNKKDIRQCHFSGSLKLLYIVLARHRK